MTEPKKDDCMKKAFQQKKPGDQARQAPLTQPEDSLRINKYLTAAGFCSRRDADWLVSEKRVRIQGKLAAIGAQVLPGQNVTVDGIKVVAKQTHVYIALNKPVGITCTVEPNVQGNIADFMDFPQRIFPIGRLDKDSSGLILLTSDGDIVNKILRAENNHEKEYIVQVDGEIDTPFVQRLQAGVRIINQRSHKWETTKKCRAEQITPDTFKIILTQGLNRQIRRMCTALGREVIALKRIRVMNIRLGTLRPGQWRYITPKELEQISG